MADKKVKRGPPSKADLEFLRKHAGRLSAEEIAPKLGRSVAQVQHHLDLIKGEKAERGLTVQSELRNRPEWDQLCNQFDDEDLNYFIYEYTKLISQFGRDDVMATEEMQIFDLIELRTMARQTKRERKPLVSEIEHVQARKEMLFAELEDLDPHDPRAKEIGVEMSRLNTRYAELSMALKDVRSRTDSYIMRSNQVLKDLKATRDQRVKVVEGSNQSFLGLLRRLQEEEFRGRVGREAGRMQLAMEKEKVRMAAPFTYDDGTVDQPLLTPETLLEDDES